MAVLKYLSKQVHVYNVGTSAFHTDEEHSLQLQLSKLEQAKKQAAAHEKKALRRQIRELDAKLRSHFETYSNIRVLPDTKLTDKSVISLFESTLTRALGIKPDTLTKELIVVETYYIEVLRSLILNGFTYQDDKYISLTASAGQIREKKTVFIRESAWKEQEGALTAGLSIATINEKGGTNTNKYLAYLALSNSATEAWDGFNIDRAIVVDDMEFPIETLVDYIDSETFEITRQVMPVKINHTDGCGMILPRKSKKSFMVRMPWVKGLLVPFAFDKFAIENGSTVVTDIYGKEWDVIKDEIEVIFTKSQFKMWKFYADWKDYTDNFKKHGCRAAKCGGEPAAFPQANTNYQVLQTLPDMTDEEIKQLTAATVDNIVRIGSDKDTMLKVLGATQAFRSKSYYQQALELYPELLADAYSRRQLSAVKKSLVTNTRAGRFRVDGIFTYIVPDLYAFCEWTFLGNTAPKGLLAAGQVSCSVYGADIKLDCLRSPHLYREHAVRENAVNIATRKWFKSKGLYTSCRDPISKLLMFDCDGDKALVIRDKTLISVAERNMEGIVPLHYEMKSAITEMLSPESIFSGLKAAYTGGNIGEVSNNIAKVWNSDDINLDAIKILCCLNNFVIDYAKTLYKPTQPDAIKAIIRRYSGAKVPHFFTYAKGKESHEVEPANLSVVNRLRTLIPSPRISFSATDLGILDYRRLMKRKNVSLNTTEAQAIIAKYTELDTSKYIMSSKTLDFNDSAYVYLKIRNKLLELNSDIDYVVDVLVKYLYVKKRSNFKSTLWSSFGDVIVRNLQKEIIVKSEDGYILCADCGERTLVVKQRQIRCATCDEKHQRERRRLQKQKERATLVVAS